MWNSRVGADLYITTSKQAKFKITIKAKTPRVLSTHSNLPQTVRLKLTMVLKW